jgi:hypothetical protein
MEEKNCESVENETIIYELSAKIPLFGFELSASSISLCSMPSALCVYLKMANFFIDEPYGDSAKK